jgi:hypothetical protein
LYVIFPALWMSFGDPSIFMSILLLWMNAIARAMICSGHDAPTILSPSCYVCSSKFLMRNVHAMETLAGVDDASRMPARHMAIQVVAATKGV